MTARIKGNVLTIDGVKSKLSPQELTVLWALMMLEFASDDDLVEMLWPDVEDQPDMWADVIKIVACSLRKKLKPAGWGVKKNYGKPWYLVEI